MSQTYNSGEFKKLKKLWYQKLKEVGFEDAEQNAENSNEPYLKEWHSCYFQERHNEQTFLIQREYYHRANQFLDSYHFETELEKSVWALHASGKSYRQIANTIKNNLPAHTAFCTHHQCDLFCPASLLGNSVVLNKDKVNAIVTKLKEVMKRLYSVREEP